MEPTAVERSRAAGTVDSVDPTPKPEIWGVCGGSGSGKSYLTTQLIDRLGDAVAVISFDAYYRDLSHLTFPERCAVNYDHPDSLETDLLVQHMAALHRGEAIHAPIYNFPEHNRDRSVEIIEPRPLILLEGILLLAVPELREQLDFVVYLDVPRELRLERRVKRDVTDRGRLEDEVRDNFDQVVGPMHDEFVEPFRDRADLVVGPDDDRVELLRDLEARAPRRRR